MTTPQDPKAPLEKTGTGDAETKTGAEAGGTGSAAGGAQGAVKPQDDDRPPQN